MVTERHSAQPYRARYTIAVEPIGQDAWHLTVRELPAIWTVAFSADDFESRARERIALDLRCGRDDFDVAFEVAPVFFVERRARRRDG